MRCQSCNYDNPADAAFCEGCGTRLELLCPACKAPVSAGARFCKKCGAALGPANPSASATVSASSTRPQIVIAADSAAPSALDGERKTVTALFADIKGSTELMEDLDPEEARAIIDPALRLMIDAVHRYDGYVVQSTGDGIFALFGAPLAHEDHPQRALYAALRLQEDLERYSARLREAGNLPIEGRVGVNTGEVVVRSITTGAGQTEYTPIGHTTNLASRMQALAPTGSIAVSEPTRKLVEGYFALKPLGPTRVKGLSEPVNVYEVTGLGPLRTRLQRAAGRGLTKFVGRDRELAALGHAADQAKAGHGQLVAAMAEAGAGKSRLYFEFKAKNQSGWMVLETFSISHGKASAYLPVIDLLRNYFGISSEDDERKRREKVTGRVVALDRSLEDTLPYLFSLLGIVEGVDPLAQMDARIKKSRTLEAIKRIVLRESLNQPLIVIFEDLHWIDEQTQEFLNLLADSIATAKILLLVNYRPEYSHQWSSKTYYTQLRLDPLGNESANQMLSALLGDSSTPRPDHDEGKRGDQPHAGEDDLIALKRLIIERTEGNPFFVEEIVQALFEEGVLLRNGSVTVARPMNAVKVPTTVQAVLAARIDRLPADEKELLQTLSVIGREFPLSLIRAVTQNPHPRGTAPARDGTDSASAQHAADAAPLAFSRNDAGEGSAELERMLADLQLAEFIYEQPAVGDTEYIFKHALTQEVAYNSLLIERRKHLQERIGNALESIFANQLDDHLAELAHHYNRGANPDKAVNYLTRAGQQALQRSAFAEAQAQLQQGLEWIKRLPESSDRDARQLGLLSTLVQVLTVTRGFSAPETRAAAERARDLAKKGGNLNQLVTQAVGIWQSALASGDYSTASLLADQILDLAQREGSPASFAFAYRAQLHVSLSRGDLVLVEELFGRVNPFLNADGFRQFPGAAVEVNGIAGICALFLGRADTARQRIAQATAIGQRNGRPYDLASGQFFESLLGFFLREPQQTEVAASRALAIAEENGFPFTTCLTLPQLGWARAQLGCADEGVELVRQGLTGLAQAGAKIAITARLTLLAEAQALGGKINDALTSVEEALQANPEDLANRPNALTCRGELRLKLSQTELPEVPSYGDTPRTNGDNLRQIELAEADFREAIALAQKMQAKAWELRATMSLARLLASQGRRDDARTILADIYNWFTEGFDTPDLLDAKALLEELSD